jgi:hypothetical protein
MSKYLKKFKTHTEYQTYITGQSRVLPNVSYCEDNNDVHYNPRIPAIIVTYNITDLENNSIVIYPNLICYEIDDVTYFPQEDVYVFKFTETGVHTVKYFFNPEEYINYFISDDDRVTSVIIEEGYKYIGQWFCMNCQNIVNVSIPKSLTYIQNGFFMNCSSLPTEGNILYADTVAVGCTDKTQTTYTIRNNTRFLADYLFKNCTNLTHITLPDTLEANSIGGQVFNGCTSLESIVIPRKVEVIENTAFDGCTSLNSVTFEEGSQLTALQGGVFNGCSSLQHLEFPSTLNLLWNNEFSGCSNLIDITFHSVVPPVLHDNTIIRNGQTFTIYVPAESVNAYKTANYWSAAANRIQAIQ